MATKQFAISFFVISSVLHADPTIYQIESTFPATDGLGPIQQSGLAFAVESDGYLLTAYAPLIHPVKGTLSKDIKIEAEHLSNKPLTIIGVEPTMGFAVVKLESEDELDLFTRHMERDFEPGDSVRAYSLDSQSELIPINGSFTQMNALDCYQQSLTGTMFRAKIDIPESGIGSPVFDAEGEVFAIHTGYQPIDEKHDEATDPGLHLLPISLAMTVYDGIKLRGNLESPWTGFSVRHLTDAEAAQFPLLNGRVKGGIAIDYVWEGSTAESLGIQPGDLLVKFAHYPIESVGDFQKWLYMYGVDHDIKLYLIRDGKMLSLDCTIEARPDWAQPE